MLTVFSEFYEYVNRILRVWPFLLEVIIILLSAFEFGNIVTSGVYFDLCFLTKVCQKPNIIISVIKSFFYQPTIL